MKVRNPYSQEAEQSLLGAMMQKPELIPLLASELTPDDFYFVYNQKVFSAIMEIHADGKPVDLIAVGELIGELHDYGNAIAYCGELIKNTPSVANSKVYAGIVKERSIDRKLALIAEQVNDLSEADIAAEDKVARAMDLVGSVIVSSDSDEFLSSDALISDYSAELERRERLDGGIDGLTTGIPELDKAIGGLRNGGLYIIAGRPKMGKTTLAMCINDHLGVRCGIGTAVYSLEMQNLDLTDKAIANVGSIPLAALKDGSAPAKYGNRLNAAAGKVAASPSVYFKGRTVTVEKIVSSARRLVYEKRVRAILVDHIGLVSVSDPKINANPVARVSEITRRLKLLAMELGIPVLAMSQLNRALEMRPNKRPIPSDLRDSGTIEQDADAVIFVYRDEVYYENTESRGVVELIVGLSRHTEASTVRARYIGAISRIESLGDYVPPPARIPYRNEGLLDESR